MLGLCNILRREGWDATPVCVGRRPSFAASLPGNESIVSFPDRLGPGEAPTLLLNAGDALAVMDTPTPDRMAAFYELHRDVLHDCPIVVFDHHYTNTRFGTVNYVDSAAAATAEVVTRVLDASGLALDAASATCLMTALVGDTQGFRTESTTVESLRLGARFAAAGAPIFRTAELLFSTRPLSAIKLWGAAMAQVQEAEGFLWTWVTSDMLAAAEATLEDAEGLVNFLLASQNTRVAVVLKETQTGATKVSIRTIPGVDATKIAGYFGGGGHQRAAGCTIDAPPRQAADRLIPRVLEELASSAPPPSVSAQRP